MKFKLCPSANPPRFGASATLTGGAATGAAIIVSVAVAVFAVFATDVAVSVTIPGLGTLAGAVYVTPAPEALLVAESVPHAAAVHPAPDSPQLTPLFALSFATVAVNVCVCPVCTDAVVGATVTDIAGVGAGVGLELGLEVELAPPPPQPPNSTAVIAIVNITDANKYLAPGCACTRVKAVSVSLVFY